MPNENEKWEKAQQAVHVFHAYAVGCAGRARRIIGRFCVDHPAESKALVELFDRMHPGLNQLPARALTGMVTKVQLALEDAQESLGSPCRRGRRARRQTVLLSFILLALALPAMLSPTHPIAVYAFLMDAYDQSLTPKVYAFAGTDLASFLISPAQVHRYRKDLRDDLMDTRSGKQFVIVRRPDGTLGQEAIRTWNGFLPKASPAFLTRWLDTKELPYVGDEVDTWLRGNEIVAIGHYHAFGGGPSAGDMKAQYFSDTPEVVVANGVVPIVYMRGTILEYGENVVVTQEIFRSLRTLELSLTMDGSRDFSFTKEPSPALRSFLGFLRDHRNVDISRRDAVARDIEALCLAFKDDYRTVFPQGFTLAPYVEDPDTYSFLGNLASLHGWAEAFKTETGTSTSVRIFSPTWQKWPPTP